MAKDRNRNEILQHLYEEIHFLEFQKAYKGFPNGEIINNFQNPPCDNSPDFILNTVKGYIGIELTRLYEGKTKYGIIPSEQDNLRIKLAEQVQSAYSLKYNNFPIVAVLRFKNEIKLRNNTLSENAKDIAEIIRNSSLKENGYTYITDELPEYLGMIAVMKENEHVIIFDEPSMSFSETPLSIDILSEMIKKKSAMIPKYTKNYKFYEKWLLCIIEPIGNLTNSSLPSINNQISKCDFDKVYVFEINKNKNNIMIV